MKLRLLFGFALFLLVSSSGRVLAQRADHISRDTLEAEPSANDFVDVDEEPQPVVPIERLIQYPDTAKRASLEGKVDVQVLIEKDGSVSKVVILRSDYDILSREAIRAMKEAKFTPAKQNGKPLRVWVTRTISFQLR